MQISDARMKWIRLRVKVTRESLEGLKEYLEEVKEKIEWKINYIDGWLTSLERLVSEDEWCDELKKLGYKCEEEEMRCKDCGRKIYSLIDGERVCDRCWIGRALLK